MTIKEIEAKSILRKHEKIDSWFISHYGMNLYRGCLHGCTYCDGRSEDYYVEGNFGEDVEVKVNAIDVLRKELDPKRKRAPLKRSFIMIGGGVGDSYQPVEEKYQLSRKVLQLMYEYNLPVHILTKSTLVERDIDLIKKINEKSRAIVSFSFSSVNDKISAVFEPGVPPPSRRLKTISLFKKAGIACGMFLMPVIPFVTDTPKLIEDSVRRASDAGVDFVIFSGMTLKDGRQKDHFLNMLKKHHPPLVEKYQKIYPWDKWGRASGEYYGSLVPTFAKIAKKYKMPVRVPPALYKDLLSENDLVVVMLEHIDHFLKLEGKKSPFGFAAYSISKLEVPLSKMKGKLQEIMGVGRATETIILEILETGKSSYYERLAA